ncbi:MAG TPA: hypothetical protein VJJ52_04600 [Candidatus Nanoarchaeia archaeon]|nr:hypothetical protein [Candidatus Nanoarchaeia archaeon]
MEKNANMRNDYIIYGILAVVFGIAAYTIFTLTNNSEVTAQEQNLNSGFQMITSGSTDPGSAQIDLTPKRVENWQLKVDFAINTHSVDLSQYDLAKITILEYGGKRINPISAPELQGHHNSGTLVFNVDKTLNKFKIIIVGIPNVQERIFEWN